MARQLLQVGRAAQRTASSWRFDKLSEVGNFCVSPNKVRSPSAPLS
ncbi:MAG: hypothetical protein V7K35_17695 [Nostoc sp.]